MRNNNSNLAKGTKGNPQENIWQSDLEKISDANEKRVESLLAESSVRETLLREVQTDKAKRIISELYRPGATIGDGGTADALIYEAVNGIDSGHKGHYKKAKERLLEIAKAIKKGLVKGDEILLEKEKMKLENAIKVWEDMYGRN